jgi:ArsR family transcriptional regulator
MKDCCQKNSKNYEKIEGSVDILKAIGESNRLKILCSLSKNKICVCDLAEQLDMPQNLLSFHLKSLYEVGILEKKREGNYIYYVIKEEWKPKIEKIFEFLDIK